MGYPFPSRQPKVASPPAIVDHQNHGPSDRGAVAMKIYMEIAQAVRRMYTITLVVGKMSTIVDVLSSAVSICVSPLPCLSLIPARGTCIRAKDQVQSQ